MIFQIIVLLAILLLTAYLATQGWFSATISFICALFASLLAGGLYEPFSSLIGGWKPNYAYGVTFLMIFFLAFATLRFLADHFIKGNVKLQIWVDRAGGAIVGLLASFVVFGTTVIGIEMFPLTETVIYHNRYPDGPQGSESKLWLNPDGFVNWTYKMSLGRSLGGAYGDNPTFAQVHPDLSTELWGYRHRVQAASNFVMPNEVMDPPVYWNFSEDRPTWGEENPVIVRMKVRKGTDFPNTSSDTDNFFRATPQQIRLIALDSDGDARQFYPVGFLNNGDPKRFVGWGKPEYRAFGAKIEPTVAAYIQDDYSEPVTSKDPAVGNIPEQVMIDFAFALPAGYKPAFLEVKALARQRVEMVPAKPATALAAYPPRKPLQESFKATVIVRDGKDPIPKQRVYILAANVKRQYFKLLISEAAAKLEVMLNNSTGKPGAGIPSSDQLRPHTNNSRDLNLSNEDTEIAWASQIMSYAVWSNMSLSSGADNYRRVADYLDKNIKPLAEDDRVNHTTLDTDKNGGTSESQLLKGYYCIVAWYVTTDRIYVWWPTFQAEQKVSTTFVLTTGKSNVMSPELKEFAPDFVWPPK